MKRRRKNDMSRYRCELCGTVLFKSQADVHNQEKHKDRFSKLESKAEKAKFARKWNARFNQDFGLTDVSISMVGTGMPCPTCKNELYLIVNDNIKKIGYWCQKAKCPATIWLQKEKADGSTELIPYKNHGNET